jgi:hypothetical protein
MADKVANSITGYEIKDVPLIKMRVSQLAQRDKKPAWSRELAAKFDLKMLYSVVVSLREGYYWIVDGQHRVDALKIFLGEGWEKQKLTCQVLHGLTEAEEAAEYLRLNNRRGCKAFDKFRIARTAGLADEVAISAAVERAGMHVSKEKDENAVACVSILGKIYRRSDAKTLQRVLEIARDSLGAPGLQATPLEGISLVRERYNGAIEDEEITERLASMRGGVGALLTRAETYRKQTRQSKVFCVAAVVVDAINAGRSRSQRLPSWWKEEEA